jgi:acetyltransferase-like isoleucine patch superfamily enzyme
MMKKYFIEQINVSDNEYKLTGIYLTSGSKAEPGKMIFSYESSKADFDVEPEIGGYIYFNDKIKVGDILQIGSLVCVINETAIESAEEIATVFDTETDKTGSANESDSEQMFTRKAEMLIAQSGISKSLFAGYAIVDEEIVKSILGKQKFFNEPSQAIEFYYSEDPRKHFKLGSQKRLAIIGAGKAALQLYDAILSAKEHVPVCLYDNDKELIGKSLMNIPIVGPIDMNQIESDYKNGNFDEIIISFSGNITARKKVFDSLAQTSIPIANVIHSTALVSNFVNIGLGNIIFANVRIGPFVEVKNNNVLSAFCSIEHHTSLGSHNTFGPAVITSGSCMISDSNRFGTGIFLEPKVKIGSNCVLSSGIVLKQNVPDNSIVRNLNKIEIKQNSSNE